MKVPTPPSGHGLLPHTADVIVEAWGLSRESCLREAVRGLVEVFADVRGIEPSSTVPLVLSPDSSEELLVTLLEDVLYLLDAEDVVPVDVAIAAADDGGVAVEFFVVASDAVRQQGAIPKAIARHGLQLRPSAGHWRCRVTVDV